VTCRLKANDEFSGIALLPIFPLCRRRGAVRFGEPDELGCQQRKVLMRLLHYVATILIASLSSAVPTTAATLPGTVLVLNRSIPYTEYFGKVLASFQSTLKAGSDIPITIYSEQLEYNHFKGPEYEKLLYTFIKEKFRSTPIGVIVADGFDALQFAVRLRTELDPAIPIVFSNIDAGTAAELSFLSNVTGTLIKRPVFQALITAKALVPGLKRIAVVGDPLEQQTYRRHYKKEILGIDKDVEVIDLTGLPMSELRKRVATLPEDAAIFYTTFSSDGAPSSSNEGLALVSEAANRPIVIDQETRLGHGGTGGFLLQAAPIGEATARILLRLFNGESASTIPVVAGEFVKPVFDWRELKQWKIPEDNLPSGSEIRFREHDAWQQFRLQIIAISTAILLQAALISWLVYEIGRRRRAEIQSRGAIAEMTHMNRRAAAGQLSASLTHEVNQPLTGMVAGASAALRWLRAAKPNVEMAESALEEVVAAGHRAGDIVASVRAMFKRDAPQKVSTDINQTIRTVLSIVSVELQKHGVELQTQLNDHLPTVHGDKVQLQQVVLNLVMNGIEAMQSVWPRVLKVQTDQPKAGIVRVSIEDTGTGIDPSNLDRIFKPLFTTKATGMGMGLSICRSIIESHGGRIWVPPADRGSIFHFELPINTARESGDIVRPMDRF
jgi:signal transduction histidine kinase